MRLCIFLQIILVHICCSKLIINNVEYTTIPLPIRGVKDKEDIVNRLCINIEQSPMKGQIILTPFDHTKNEIEPFIRQLEKQYQPAAIILKSLKYVGGSLFQTDGRQYTDDITVPVVDIDDEYYLKIMNLNQTNCTLTFEEENYFYTHMISTHWMLLESIFIWFSLFGFIYGCYILWLLRGTKFSNKHLALSLEILSNFCNFFLALDFNGTRLLFHFKFSRVLVTFSYPFILGARLLFIIYAGYVLTKVVKQQKAKPFMTVKWVKIAFISVFIFLFIIESLTVLIYLTVYQLYEFMVMVTYMIYGILFAVSCVLYSIVLYLLIKTTEIRLFKTIEYVDKDITVRSQIFLKKFIFRFIFSLSCNILLLISFFMNLFYPSIKDFSTRVLCMYYGPLVGYLALSFASIGNIVSYHPDNDPANIKVKQNQVESYSTPSTMTMNNVTSETITMGPNTIKLKILPKAGGNANSSAESKEYTPINPASVNTPSTPTTLNTPVSQNNPSDPGSPHNPSESSSVNSACSSIED